MIWEIITVFAVSLGINTLHATISFIGSLTEREALSVQHAVLNSSRAPGRPWLDPFPAACQHHQRRRAGGAGLVPASQERRAALLDRDRRHTTRPRPAPRRGTGRRDRGCGLGLYYLAFKAGIALNIVAANLPGVWWRFPVLLLSALQDGLLEEILVVGYLLSRLRLLGVSPAGAVAISAAFRGSYHLYQGFGAFIGNAIMGVIFAVLFLRWHRTNPMIIAHFLINAVAFIGYTLLAGHVSWLP